MVRVMRVQHLTAIDGLGAVKTEEQTMCNQPENVNSHAPQATGKMPGAAPTLGGRGAANPDEENVMPTDDNTTENFAATSDRLLTEVERQRKYLAELPPGFDYPLFNTLQPLESQRQSGYRSTAAAAREIVDDAAEANASQVHVLFDIKGERKDRRKEREVVSAVAFIDDGAGMLPDMARFALFWGGRTHFKDPDYLCEVTRRCALIRNRGSQTPRSRALAPAQEVRLTPRTLRPTAPQ